MKKKLGNVTEDQVSVYLDHFLNHYLKEEQQQEEVRDDRTSLNSNLDWSDKAEIQNYCLKQENYQERRGVRISEYFGAIQVETLDEDV